MTNLWYFSTGLVQLLFNLEKGQSFIILHAGATGFRAGQGLVFNLKTNSTDYRDEINLIVFIEWSKDKFIIIDNASHHNTCIRVPCTETPTTAWQKYQVRT